MVAEHITNLPSGKNSGKRTRTQMLVVHSAETPLAAGYAASVTSNWLNRADVEASINAFFGPDTTVRSVNTDYAAWHATWANAVSVGYEFTGYAALTRTQWLTDAGKTMLDRAGREMAEDAKLYGIPLRYLTTAEVNQIANGNTTIKGIATHRQIDPVNRTDPGDGFPYDVLLASIRKYAGGNSATPTTKPQGSTKPTPIPATPKPTGVLLMALTDAEQKELLTKTREIHRDYIQGVPGRNSDGDSFGVLRSILHAVKGKPIDEAARRKKVTGK